jgi:hypothetical protein
MSEEGALPTGPTYSLRKEYRGYVNRFQNDIDDMMIRGLQVSSSCTREYKGMSCTACIQLMRDVIGLGQ